MIAIATIHYLLSSWSGVRRLRERVDFLKRIEKRLWRMRSVIVIADKLNNRHGVRAFIVEALAFLIGLLGYD